MRGEREGICTHGGSASGEGESGSRSQAGGKGGCLNSTQHNGGTASETLSHSFSELH